MTAQGHVVDPTEYCDGAVPGTTGPVITGLGVMAPNGLGTDVYWKAVQDGNSGLGPLTTFDATAYPLKIAGLIHNFVPEEHVPRKLLAQTDRMTRMALTAADWALKDAEIDPAATPAYDMSVVTASSAGGFEFGQRELQKLWSLGPEHVSVYQSFAWFYAVNTGQISILHGMRGPSGVLVTEQAGGLDALGKARQTIRDDGVPIVLAGGVDSSLCPWALTCQIPGGRLSEGADPRTAYLPFDQRANGYVPGEGGALLVLEDEQHAARRNAHVHGRLIGYAATFDPPPAGDRPPGLARAIRLALADSGLDERDIDFVLADGMARPAADLAEAEALAEVFGPRGVPVAVPKTLVGRLYSGAGSLDVATALLCIRDGVLPSSAITRPAHPDLIDLVMSGPRCAHLRTGLVLARGDGGFNTAVIVRDL